jgi:hypothetical protein
MMTFFPMVYRKNPRETNVPMIPAMVIRRKYSLSAVRERGLLSCCTAMHGGEMIKNYFVCEI